jgi:hypothetical protein
MAQLSSCIQDFAEVVIRLSVIIFFFPMVELQLAFNLVSIAKQLLPFKVSNSKESIYGVLVKQRRRDCGISHPSKVRTEFEKMNYALRSRNNSLENPHIGEPGIIL